MVIHPSVKAKFKWYAIHVKSGQENTVQKNLESRIRSMNAESKFGESVIPTHDIAEIKNGKRVISTKRSLPGYIIIQCVMDDESWELINNTPGVISFSGQRGKPTPLRQSEVNKFLSPQEDSDNTTLNADIGFEIGDGITVKSGPFSGNSGYVSEVYPKTLKIKAMVNLFGRETSVELGIDQISKI